MIMMMASKRLLASLLVCTLLVAAVQAANSDKVSASIDLQDAAGQAAAKSQITIDRIADQSDQLLAEYRQTLRQYESLKAYNDHVQKLVDSQQLELESIAQQLADIAVTNQGVVPLMVRMVDALEQFIALDIPFLPEERGQRVASLKILLDRADVTVAEKYRRIMEAFQIEMEYGRTIEAYDGFLGRGSENLSVAFLRIGRVALIYQTLDKKEVAIWNRQSGDWELLSGEYNSPVAQGLRIARKQAVADLLKLPIPAPERLQ